MLGNLPPIFWPYLAREVSNQEERTTDGVHRGLYLLRCPNNQEPSMFAMLVTVFVRGMYLWAIKNYASPTMMLNDANLQMVQRGDVEEDQLPLSQLQATQSVRSLLIWSILRAKL